MVFSKRLTLLIGTLLLPGLAQATPEPPIASGKMMGDTCASCHGTRGKSFDEYMPSLAGIDRQQLIRAMRDYRADRRASVVMNRIAKGYNDREIEAIADYFSRIK